MTDKMETLAGAQAMLFGDDGGHDVEEMAQRLANRVDAVAASVPVKLPTEDMSYMEAAAYLQTQRDIAREVAFHQEVTEVVEATRGERFDVWARAHAHEMDHPLDLILADDLMRSIFVFDLFEVEPWGRADVDPEAYKKRVSEHIIDYLDFLVLKWFKEAFIHPDFLGGMDPENPFTLEEVYQQFQPHLLGTFMPTYRCREPFEHDEVVPPHVLAIFVNPTTADPIIAHYFAQQGGEPDPGWSEDWMAAHPDYQYKDHFDPVWIHQVPRPTQQNELA